MKTQSSARGFTLVEIMVVVTVSAVLLAGVLSFYLETVKGMYATDQRVKLAGQIKKFANELSVQASRSNQFVLYKSVAPADFDGPNPAPNSNNSDRQIIDVDDPSNPLHPAGDFVVFVYYEIPKPAAQPFYRITRLEGYYLKAAAGGLGSIMKIVIDLSGAPSTNSVEAILTANWNTLANNWNSTVAVTKYFPLARGLLVPEVIDGTPVSVPPPPPRMFYMSDARNVIISGQLFSSALDVSTGDAKTSSNSFFFNITPRT